MDSGVLHCVPPIYRFRVQEGVLPGGAEVAVRGVADRARVGEGDVGHGEGAGGADGGHGLPQEDPGEGLGQEQGRRGDQQDDAVR